MKKYDVVISGYTCVDLIPDFKKAQSVTSFSNLFIPGKLIEIEGINFVLGGVVPNTGLALKKFDKKVYLLMLSSSSPESRTFTMTEDYSGLVESRCVNEVLQEVGSFGDMGKHDT